MTALRIAMDGRSLAQAVAPRGWDRYTMGLASQLTRRGVHVTFLCRESQAAKGTIIERACGEVRRIPDAGGAHWEQVALPRALRRGRFDVYHATAEHGIPFLAPCPVALTVHSLTRHSYGELVAKGRLPPPAGRYGPVLRRRSPRYWYWRLQVARADHLLVPSEFCRNELLRHLRVRAQRVTVAPLALSEEFTEAPAARDRRDAVRATHGIRQPYVLSVGGYEPHKNPEGTLAAFAALRLEFPGVQLVMIGTGPAPHHLMSTGARLGLGTPDDVLFLSDVGPDLVCLYDDAAAFMSLSWRETFGLPALEAVSRGVPVVTSGWGAAIEVLGSAATFVDPTDVKSAARALGAALRRDFGAAHVAREAAARFSWSRTADIVLDVYERLIRSRRGTPHPVRRGASTPTISA